MNKVSNKEYSRSKTSSLPEDPFSIIELKCRLDKLSSRYYQLTYYKHFKQFCDLKLKHDIKAVLKGLLYYYVIYEIDPLSIKLLLKKEINPVSFIKGRVEYLNSLSNNDFYFTFHEWLKESKMKINTGLVKHDGFISISHFGKDLMNELALTESGNDFATISFSYNNAKFASIERGNKYLEEATKRKNKGHFNKKYSNKLVEDFFSLKRKGYKNKESLEALKQKYPNNKYLRTVEVKSFSRSMYYRR